ncbi:MULTISPECIES: NAD(P)/FAD-dependent oxidoreductase [unclassified Phycicoccus]|uniref:NAD(P)/FAD-dependent oxidoreductase n=1 Tax=unclassified Phycicoccus TaxID=2637926 RepID=UPI000703AD44|nr:MULTISPECIES: NAD(P)/FAD-dependent oxidoreductase [unclassified Phycicoccus]KRF25449.1 thioredoxin reductase [Phycicoccus sp. Soil803]KRF27939.1 thioredoxin reductase [Phycicoccus sp. Soil802]
MNTHDILIVGGGAAGLSAALVLSRARRDVVVVDAGVPRNAPAAHLQGFLSRDGMAPSDLLEAGRAEATGYGAVIVGGTVTELVHCGQSGFQALLEDGQRLRARKVLVTTGLHDELPDVPGLAERWAKDVLHCPYCHGWEVRDQQLGVLWNGPDSVRYAQVVRQWTHDLVLFAPTGTLTAADRTQLVARAIGIVEGPLERVVVQDDRVTAVELADGRIIPRQAVFVPPRFVPNAALLAGVGCDLDEEGWVVTGASGTTSVPGLWVAGNVTNARAQVITAAGEGSAAAIAINADLVGDDVRTAVTYFNQGFPA